MKYGIFDKVKGKVVRSYNHSRMKSLKLGTDEVQFEMAPANGTHYEDEKAYILDNDIVTYDDTYTPFDSTLKNCKIYRYIENARHKYDLKTPPKGHDYTVGLDTTLFPKRSMDQGEVFKVEWYADQELTDLVIQVDIEYTRDMMGFAVSRNTIRTWYLEDDTAHANTKVTVKKYDINDIDQIKEGIRRRGNIVEGLQKPVLGYMIYTVPALSGEDELSRQGRVLRLGRQFLARHKEGFRNFIDDSNKEIIETIEDGIKSSDFWLENIIDGEGTTIRDFIVKELDIEVTI